MKKLFGFILFAVISFSTSFAFADCFMPDRGMRFRAVAHDVLEIQDFGRIYQLEVGFCSDLRFARRIGFRSFGGSRWICDHDDLLIMDPYSNRVRERCRIFSVNRVN